ncbi:MAG: hypothetical protein SPG14_08680 [Lactobacillus amylovorus]|nr:hypothetical protein [Lactobacillus amylovorus]
MALISIAVLALIVMIITCLPVTQRYFYKYLGKIGYWSLLIIFIIYLLIDIWLWLRRPYKTADFWLTFISINIAGMVAITKTYFDIKKLK